MCTCEAAETTVPTISWAISVESSSFSVTMRNSSEVDKDQEENDTYLEQNIKNQSE